MGKVNWDRERRKKTLAKLDSLNWAQRKTGFIPPTLDALFEKAIELTKGSHYYRVVFSMRRHFLLRGWISVKQSSYLRSLARQKNPLTPEEEDFYLRLGNRGKQSPPSPNIKKSSSPDRGSTNQR